MLSRNVTADTAKIKAGDYLNNYWSKVFFKELMVVHL
jgi:hypothetical protein